MNEHKKKYTLFFENVININVNVHYLYLNLQPTQNSYSYTNLSNNTIEIQNDLYDNIKYMYIELICNKTCDNNFIFTLKNIL